MRSSEEKLLLLLEAKIPMNILHPSIAGLLTPDHRDNNGVGWVSNRTVAKMMDGEEFQYTLKEIQHNNLQNKHTDDGDSDYIEQHPSWKDK